LKAIEILNNKSELQLMADHEGSLLDLVARRTIRASAERLFAAWTEPEHFLDWWGPASVDCVWFEIDLQVGGGYQIGNEHPDGSITWISGEFEEIERPHRFVFTWRLRGSEGPPERVIVRFDLRDDETEVIVIHQRITSAAARDSHELGWHGCLYGLNTYLTS
jgi:uncharacterized protein YndB with AHSA1/START domain